VAIERGIIRFLYGRPLETLLATFDLSLVLQQLVRTLFSPLNRCTSLLFRSADPAAVTLRSYSDCRFSKDIASPPK